MPYLDIHMEGDYKNPDALNRVLDSGIICAVSVIPYRLKNGWYDDKLVHVILRAAQIGTLGQHGNRHRCPYEEKHKIADPAHENFCFYHRLSYSNQRELMEEGNKTLISILGIKPELYVPPNHVYTSATLLAANAMGFRFFAEMGQINREPYKNGKMIMLPEVELGRRGRVYYVHYDELTPELINTIKDMHRFHEITPKEISTLKKEANELSVKARKLARDGLRLARIIKR